MEDVARQYEGQVRFLYMYTREAHPIPETAPCGSTEELGWNHPSWDTLSLEHRAQRARWLKEDLGLTFPWIIDPMNRAVAAAYGGSGFYAGWVIDCDGTVRVAERWGWATPQTQWCGLPLPAFNELTAFLDQYLADPPPCYRGVAPVQYESVVATAAHLGGTNQTTWRTDLTLANPGSDSVTATVFLLKRDQSNAVAEAREFEVPGGATRSLSDVLMSEFEFTGAGALLVRSAVPLIVVSRTYNQTPAGSFGQWIPAVPVHSAIGGPAVGHLPMLTENGSQRTNLGLTSLSSQPVSTHVDFVAADGSSLGSAHFDLDPLEHIQINRVLELVSDQPVVAARATVSVDGEQGRVVAYASVVDNTTGDPTFVPAIANSWSADSTIPAVASTEGSHGTSWSTDISVVNASIRPIEASLEFTDASGDRYNDVVTIDPSETVPIQDLVGTSFGIDGAGSLAISSNPGVLTVSRTYNHGGTGTYGQYVAANDLSAAAVVRPGDTAHLVQLEQGGAEGIRSNLGLVNLSEVPAIVELEFYDRDGAEIGSFRRRLEARQWRQINSVLETEFGLEEVSGIRVELRIVGDEGKITAYVSTVDNRTGDPVFQPATMVESAMR